MKALKVAVISLTLILAGCGAKVLHDIKQEAFHAVFYDTPCSVKEVKELAVYLGVPSKVIENMKEGVVTFTDKTPKRKFCYMDNKTSAFVIDEMGDMGQLEFVQPKK